jgi:hypothetical protein
VSPATNYPWGEHSRPGPLTEAELDAHNAEMHSGPAPLGYESAPCPGICQQGRCSRPDECLDFADSSAYGQFVSEDAQRRATDTEWLARVISVAILASIAAGLWAVLS